jgi:raffinose/stachyose/melibiose transport system substrate-binding protein
MIKKLYLVMLVFFIAAMVFAGGQQEPAQAAGMEEEVTLVFWDWQAAGNWGDVVKQVSDEYTKTHPNVKVDRKSFSYGDYNAVLKTALASGEGPDVFEVHPGAPSRDLAMAGQLVDLTDIIKNDAEWSKWIAPALNVPDMYIDGKMYYVAADMNHLPLVFWREMFDSRGLELPTTIDELFTVGKKLQADDIQPISGGFKDIWSSIDMFTVQVRTADKTKDLIDRANLGNASWVDPLFKQALQNIVDMKEASIIPNNVLELAPWPDGIDTFNKKESSMFWTCGQFGLSSLDQEELMNEAIGELPFPRMDSKGTSLFTGGASITMSANASAPQMDIIIDYLKFWNGPYGQEAIFDSLRTPPGALVTKASSIPLFTEMTNNQNNMEIGYRYIDNPDIYKAVADGIQKALIGGDVDEILAEIEKVSQDVN